MSEFEKELLDAIMESIKPAMIEREWIQKHVAPIIEKYTSEKDAEINKYKSYWEQIGTRQ